MSDTPEGYIIDYTETSSGCHCAWCGKAIHSQMSYFSKDYSKAYCDWCFDNIMRPDPDENKSHPCVSCAKTSKECPTCSIHNPKPCSCTLENLMRHGCRCGGK